MKTTKIVMIVVFTSIIILSCKKSDKKTSDVLSQDIYNLVPDSIINVMRNLGMPINGGNTPPDIQKIYVASPFKLKATNFDDPFPIGFEFAAYYVKFYNQDNTNMTVKLDYKNGPETGTGIGNLISGCNSSFSVFAKLRATSANGLDSADIVQVISGTIISGAIQNMYFANFMLNNYGNTNHYWIGNGQGRVIYDSDGNSWELSSFKSAHVENSGSSSKSAMTK